MITLPIIRSSIVVPLLGGLVACSDNSPSDTPQDAPPVVPPDAPPQEAPKAIYILSNEADANRVIVFERAADGSLRPDSAYATGGRGSASGLGSQGSLVFDAATRRLFAVNAGDNSISMLTIESDGSLSARSTVPSGGVKPLSITASGDLVYVVNGGDTNTPANIAGFRITGNALGALAGSS